MAYVSLYRKYRPQTFGEVVGQDHVTRSLVNAIREDRLHHAYLFAGPRGTGKTSTARILAKSINCVEGPTPEPCNTCVQCVAITNGSSVDVIELDMASHGGVDDARELRDRAQFAPASARRKVYILDEVHMASTAAFNALLKLIEEPPGHVLFAMATTDPQKVLPTILSRVQRLDLRRVGAADVAGRVRDLVAREGGSIDDAAIDLVVRAGDGSVRDTESVLEQVLSYADGGVTGDDVAEVLGQTTFEHTAVAVDAVVAGDLARAFAKVQDLLDDGTDLRQFTLDLVGHVRDLLVLVVAPDRPDLVDATADRRDALVAQAARMERDSLTRALDELATALEQMRQGPARLALELALARIATRPGAPTPDPATSAPPDSVATATGPDEPGPDEPGPDEPGPAEPGPDEPGPDEPGADELGVDEPRPDQPAIADSAPDDSAAAGGSESGGEGAVDAEAGAADDVAAGSDTETAAAEDDATDDEGTADEDGATDAQAPVASAGDDSAGDAGPVAVEDVGPADDEADMDGDVAGEPEFDDAAADEADEEDAAEGLEESDTSAGDELPGADFATRADARAERVARDGLPDVPRDRPAGPSVEVAEPPSRDDAADLDRIRARWDAILELVRAESKRSHAIFEPAQVLALRNGVLALGYGRRYKSFHATNAVRSEFADDLRGAIEQATSASVTLDIRVDGDEPRRPQPRPMDEPHDKAQDDGQDEAQKSGDIGAPGEPVTATPTPLADLDPSEAMDRAAAAVVERLGGSEVDPDGP